MELPQFCLLCSAKVERRGQAGRASVPYPREDTGISVSTYFKKRITEEQQNCKQAPELPMWTTARPLARRKTYEEKSC